MTLEITTTSYYRVGGNLPPDAPSYVKREADEQLYQKLKSGEFCYVLNSRQMGKSSLWVRVKQKLEPENYLCAAIDLSGIGQGDKEQWYTSFANRLTKSFEPSVKKQWRSWWKEQVELAPIEKLHQLIEELLLPSLLPYQKLIIFIDEIDYVKGLPFSTDDFFALIRSCYNERSLNPQFNQMTFCLLGVATPADLIENKQLTPFNIGTGIELQGFRQDEAEPLIAGLKGKVTSPESVMSDILTWTGGQPFLTQRLCNLVVKENNPTPDIAELVHRQIIDNWETQDEQEHLRTIQNRILSNEQRAGYLLELYRKVLQQGQVPLNNSSEERELQLSGLVVKRNNALEVYNPIYARVFNQSWIDSELEKLRPYAQNFRDWLLSGKIDDSRLLRGQALKDAQAWALEKNLGGEDLAFLGESQYKERQEERAKEDKEAELERERKAREFAQKAEQIQAEANRQAQQKIRIGTIILILALLGAVTSAVWGSLKFQAALKAQSETKEAIHRQQKAEEKFKEVKVQLDKAQQDLQQAEQRVKQAQEQEIKAKKQVEEAEKQKKEAEKQFQEVRNQLNKTQEDVKKANQKAKEAQELVEKANQELKEAQQAKADAKNALTRINKALNAVRELSVLAGELRKEGQVQASSEALRKAGLSTLIKNEELKQTFLLAATAEAYGNKKREKAQETLTKLNLDSLNNNKSQLEQGILNQVKAFAYFQAGQFKDEKNYQYAYNALKVSNFNPYNPNVEKDILTEKDVEEIHYRLIKSQAIDINSKTDPIAISFRKHLYDGLWDLLQKDRLKEADFKTTKVMLYIADRWEDKYFTVKSLQEFDCEALGEIDQRWYDYPKRQGHFGFRVQKEIWQSPEIGSPTINSPIEDWRKFYIKVGWKTEESGIEDRGGYVSYEQLGAFKDIKSSLRGNLPSSSWRGLGVVLLGEPSWEEPLWEWWKGRDGFLALRTVTCKI